MFRIPKPQVIPFEFFDFLSNCNSAIKIPKSIELIKKPPKCLSGFVSQWNQNSYEFTFEFANWYSFMQNILIICLQNFCEIAIIETLIETQPHKIFDSNVFCTISSLTQTLRTLYNLHNVRLILLYTSH